VHVVRLDSMVRFGVCGPVYIQDARVVVGDDVTCWSRRHIALAGYSMDGVLGCGCSL